MTKTNNSKILRTTLDNDVYDVLSGCNPTKVEKHMFVNAALRKALKDEDIKNMFPWLQTHKTVSKNINHQEIEQPPTIKSVVIPIDIKPSSGSFIDDDKFGNTS